MNIYLKGHEYRYAAEQALMSFFPDQRPEYPDGAEPEGNCVILSLDGARAAAELRLDGRTVRGEAEADGPVPENGTERDRLLQKLVKLAFFRAAVELRGSAPPWGALTGVRPVKLAAKYMRQTGLGPAETAEYMSEEYCVSPGRAELCARAAEYSLKADAELEEKDVLLYVGIPFCPSRCSYCSFVSSSVERSLALIGDYVEALLREISAAGRLAAKYGMNVAAVYFGGGTPTTLSPESLDRLMGELADAFDLSRCREYTVEAGRPDTVTEEKLETLRRRGAGRISINPQTMNDRVLAAIGRRHTAGDVLTAFALAREHFPGDINMDLIAGLPGDGPDSFRRSLDTVLGLGPENVTVHTLTMKRSSRLSAEGGGIPEGEAAAEMLGYAYSVLPSAGFSPYYLYRQKFSVGGFENTGWCLRGHESLYNIGMMEELRSVIALGAGGATKLVHPGSGKIDRVFNKKYPYEYIASSGCVPELEKLLG
ncbi:MAG: coproporphyrinogen dehydrogenase HemZ [Oscillospiraceae bacterium]|nr:coproporphyrinogen dehydrogenase HemZ [Oscillospiraceae bacterium]